MRHDAREIVRVSEVTKDFRPGLGLRRKRVLHGISFGVREGEIFGFVGPNGAGKTTAMRIVLGVLAADRGEVRFRDAPVDFATRSRFGYMPEERGLYPKMRVRDQLIYLARLHGVDGGSAGRAADRWIETLGLSDRAGDRVEALSLGNQQRVQLAAALVHDPELLVLDEPFSGLDPVGVDVLSGVLSDYASTGVPVVFSSHQLELVERLCEGVAIIKDGRLVASGPVEELRDRVDELGLLAEGRVVDERPDLAAVALDGRRRAPRPRQRQDDRPAVTVGEVPVLEPVGDLEGRVAERGGDRVAQRRSLADRDDHSRDFPAREPHANDPEQERERLDRRHREHERQHQRQRGRAADSGQQPDDETHAHPDHHQAERFPLKDEEQALDEGV